MITDPCCALSSVCLRLCFESCKTTQNVTFHNNLHNVIQSSFNKDVLSMIGKRLVKDDTDSQFIQ